MGGLFGKRQPEHKILMIGLKSSGKTTILNTLKDGRFITHIGTRGNNVDRFKYQDVFFSIRIIDNVQDHWYNHVTDTKAVIFVVDSNNREDVELARAELMAIVAENEIRNAAILVFANKKDMPNALTKGEITDQLRLSTINKSRGRNVFINATCGIKEHGIREGIHWLAEQLQNKD